MSRVAVVKGDRGLEPVYDALDLIQYEEAFKDWNRVLVKVNFITTKNWETGATTDPMVVEAIVNRLKDIDKEVIIVESDAQTTNADKAWIASGMKELGDRLDVQFINMRHVEKVELQVDEGLVLNKIKVAKIATESAIVSAAKLKTHMGTQVTLGLKNMFGMLTTKWKGKFHLKGMHKVIHDINKTLPPHVTVIDGFIGMEGRGPVRGDPVKMDTIIASTDPVASDATGSKIMGFNPEEIDHIRWCNETGIGNMNNIEIIGEDIEAVKQVFKRK